MRRIRALLTAIAALFLATGTAHADKWEADQRHCHIRKHFSNEELSNMLWNGPSGSGQTIVIEEEEIPGLLKEIAKLKSRHLTFCKHYGRWR